MHQEIFVETKTESNADDRDEDPIGRRPASQTKIHPIFGNHYGLLSLDHNASLTNAFKPKKLINFTTRSFRKKYYRGVTDKHWNNWHWQIQNRIRSLSQLARILDLTREEREAMEISGTALPLGITPYFASLIDSDRPDHALRKTVVPSLHELFKMPCESDDPLGEDHQSPVPGLVHRYPDRALLMVTDFCSTYCRYCTRSRVVGNGTIHPNRSRLQMAVEYIRNHPMIRDVVISGGDPLTLSDDRLEWLLQQLRSISHLEIIRIGTKVPVVLPQRVTPKLVRMLRKYHPIWMSLHFIHPEECTPETYKACEMLADAGIPLGSQTVLLKGVNDDVNTMKALMHHLMRMRVRPYYLYQCDPISGSGHFRTSIEKGLEIIKGLRGFTSGYAVPTYVVDAPGGGGKIPLMPDYVQGYEKDNLVMRNYEGNIYRYPDERQPFTPQN
jgi:lysine 2,3-aminomutase